MSAYPERPPRLGLRQLGKAALAALMIVAATGTAVAVTGVREVESIVGAFAPEGRTLATIPEIDRAEIDGPRTILILGSDKRLGEDAESPPRSDTMLLVRADPDQDAITVMSIPRDLEVEIPGEGKNKINYAFEAGGARLAVRTVQRLFESRTGEDFPINNVMTVDYGGFRRAVDYIGGVYVDIDRDYFNDNSGGTNYATIDVNPGYQKLKGQKALDYVRYRYGDNDLVRAARQQDFLRQAKNAAGVRKLLAIDDRQRLADIFGRYFQVDESFRETGEVIAMLKLALFLATEEPKVNEVRFRVTTSDDPQLNTNLYVSDDDLQTIYDEFMSTRGSATPRQNPEGEEAEAEAPERERRPRRERRFDPDDVSGMEATGEGEAMAVLADPELKDMPFYFPTRRLEQSRYASQEPRLYTIKDETGEKHEAYRLVLSTGNVGEYYGVQGTTWKTAPILDNPDRTRTVDGRDFRLYYDGSRLRLVAWETRNGVYWISNTLTQTIGEDQMLALASGLRRLGQ